MKGEAVFSDSLIKLGGNKSEIENIPKKTIYILDKKDCIIYRVTTYSKKGDIISDIRYKDVQVNAPLADNLFEIPPGIKVVLVMDEKTHARKLIENQK